MVPWHAAAIAEVPAPRFVGASDEDAALFATAWQEAAACAGRNAPFHDEVVVVYTSDPWGWAGHAHKDADGMYRISLHEGYERRTVVHEVAHAWVSSASHTPD